MTRTKQTGLDGTKVKYAAAQAQYLKNIAAGMKESEALKIYHQNFSQHLISQGTIKRVGPKVTRGAGAHVKPQHSAAKPRSGSGAHVKPRHTIKPMGKPTPPMKQSARKSTGGKAPRSAAVKKTPPQGKNSCPKTTSRTGCEGSVCEFVATTANRGAYCRPIRTGVPQRQGTCSNSMLDAMSKDQLKDALKKYYKRGALTLPKKKQCDFMMKPENLKPEYLSQYNDSAQRPAQWPPYYTVTRQKK